MGGKSIPVLWCKLLVESLLKLNAYTVYICDELSFFYHPPPPPNPHPALEYTVEHISL